jgi:hypothetical protein
MIAEDRQGVRGQRAGGNVEDRGGQLPGDLEHVGDHQQQALRGREGGRQRPGLQRPVDRAGGAASLCISTTSGTVPKMFLRPADHWSAHSPMGDDGVMG